LEQILAKYCVRFPSVSWNSAWNSVWADFADAGAGADADADVGFTTLILYL